ncbi:uncharacterized protein AMSG_06718 [Thecamonas trahens ATCC 50062]|uniref:Cation channel sperm-associated protein subunit beta C-terminal domain-containing protein n=1 Tax=Thecamonas trahens ATCC 50062 TaxID=461836 RepID=A0A0L0DF13_THETB|nr:hypothetical protein AMSG_06718 [Thecamonas trahens ATCC 50062]KNC50815.1 hypothetical protein AMSG_06718 [Thecamonas trahens ATCC 50062]|eukprot:XP_013756770.1 hypothetical protein AMSG_06718 [Thecamonas trahens ATCC 50062]
MAQCSTCLTAAAVAANRAALAATALVPANASAITIASPAQGPLVIAAASVPSAAPPDPTWGAHPRSGSDLLPATFHALAPAEPSLLCAHYLVVNPDETRLDPASLVLPASANVTLVLRARALHASPLSTASLTNTLASAGAQPVLRVSNASALALAADPVYSILPAAISVLVASPPNATVPTASPLPLPPLPLLASRVAVDPCHTSMLALVSSSSLFVSFDFGTSWLAAASIGVPGTFLAAADVTVRLVDGFVVLASGGSVHISRDRLGSLSFNASVFVDLGAAGSSLLSTPSECLPTRLLAPAASAPPFPYHGIVASPSALVELSHDVRVNALHPSVLAGPVSDVAVSPGHRAVAVLVAPRMLRLCSTTSGTNSSLCSIGTLPRAASKLDYFPSGGALLAYGASSLLVSRDLGRSWRVMFETSLPDSCVAAVIVSDVRTPEYVALVSASCSSPRAVVSLYYGSMLSETLASAGTLPPSALAVHFNGPGSLRYLMASASGSLSAAYVPLLALTATNVSSLSGELPPASLVANVSTAGLPLARDAGLVVLTLPGSADALALVGPVGLPQPALPGLVAGLAGAEVDALGTGRYSIEVGSVHEALGLLVAPARWLTPPGGVSMGDGLACSLLSLSLSASSSISSTPLDGLSGVWAGRNLYSVDATVELSGCASATPALAPGESLWLDGGARVFRIERLVSSNRATGRLVGTSPTAVSLALANQTVSASVVRHVKTPAWRKAPDVAGETSAAVTLACLAENEVGSVLSVAPSLPTLAASRRGMLFANAVGVLLAADRVAVAGRGGCGRVQTGTPLAAGTDWTAVDIEAGVLAAAAPRFPTRAAAECTATTGRRAVVLGGQDVELHTPRAKAVVLDRADSMDINTTTSAVSRGCWSVAGGLWTASLSVTARQAGAFAAAPLSTGVEGLVLLRAGGGPQLACGTTSGGTWIVTGCSISKRLEMRLSESAEAMMAGTVDVHTLPVNYRPPSRLGKGIPISAYIYHGDPSAPRHRNEFGVSKRSGRYQRCAGASSRSGCRCSRRELFAPAADATDCLAVAPTVLFANRFIPAFGLVQEGLAEVSYLGRYEIRELNNRSDWCTNSSACDDRSVYQMTAGALDALVWGGDELFHFEVRALDPSFCSLTAEFTLWVDKPPIQFLELWAVITLTLVAMALGLLGLYGLHKWRLG